MPAFLMRRLGYTVVVLFGVTLIIFFAVRLAPGDPAKMMLPDAAPPEAVEALRTKLGLNKPLHIQYVVFLKRAITGDFGDSYFYRAPVVEVVWEALKRSASLAFVASSLTIGIGVPLGVLAAVRRNSAWEYTAMFVAVLGQAMPVFVLGLLVILIFSVYLGWFPTSGAGTWKHLVLPSFTLAAYSLALITRLTRSCMLDELSKDYVRTARSKGLRERKITTKHAFRNTILPVITVAGVQLGGMLGGTVVTETVFSYPGLGLLVINSVTGRDYPLLQYAVLVSAAIFVFINLFVDLLYAVADPRVENS